MAQKGSKSKFSHLLSVLSSQLSEVKCMFTPVCTCMFTPFYTCMFKTMFTCMLTTILKEAMKHIKGILSLRENS